MEHELELFQNGVIGVVLALLVSSFIMLLYKKIKVIPYTVLLVSFGLFIQPGYFAPFDTIRLNPGMVLNIILPILLFESAFNFDFNDFKKVLKPAFLLSTIGLLISAIIITIPLHLFFKIDFFAALLFASVISSTDPIAVLAIFKELGVPKRLQLLVDGESFLNDGTSVIMFKILLGLSLGVVNSEINNQVLIVQGVENFLIVFFGGAIIGTIMGWIFAQIISYIKNVNSVEILLTILLSTSVFIIADHYFKVSGIIAVLMAGLIMGNYGKNKISPQIVHEMHQVWNMLVFISTSIVFLLIGYEIHIFKLMENILIIFVTIITLLIARSISVYAVGGFNNLISKHNHEKISWKWLHIINLGGLRGSLPLIMILLLPENFHLKELFIDITLGVITFTLLINASIIKYIIEKLNINELNSTNKIEMNLIEVLILERVLEQMKGITKTGEIKEQTYLKHKERILEQIKSSINSLEDLISNNNKEVIDSEILKIIDRYCLNLEKASYTSLYQRAVINEGIYNQLSIKINEQIEDINTNEKPFTQNLNIENYENTDLNRFFEDKVSIFTLINKVKGIKFSDQIKNLFLYHKARLLGDINIINELESFKNKNYSILSDKIVETKIEQYKKFKIYNEKTLEKLESKFPEITQEAEENILECESDELLKIMINKLGEEGRVSEKALNSLDLKI